MWTLASHTTPANAGITAYVSSGTGVATLPDGTLVTAYPMNSDVYYQVGAGPVQTWSSGECCVYDMTLAYDNGVVWAAWSNNGTTPSTQGLFVRTIYPVLGPVIKAPKSTSKDGYAAIGQGAAFTARNGGGTYFAYCVGYPFCETVVLWQVGTSQVLKVPESADAAQVAISAAPSGRLWIGWASEADEVYAVRTNTKANGFGAVRHLPAPKKSQGVYDLFIEGTRARADIVFNDSIGDLAPAGLRRPDAQGRGRPVVRLARREDRLQGHRRRRRRPGGDGQGQVERQQAHVQDRREREVQDHVPQDGQEQDQGERHEGGLRPGRDEAQGQLRSQRTRTTDLPRVSRSSMSCRARPKPSRSYVAPIGGSIAPASSNGSRAAHCCCM